MSYSSGGGAVSAVSRRESFTRDPNFLEGFLGKLVLEVVSEDGSL